MFINLVMKLISEPRRKAFLDYLIEIAHSEKGSFTEQELREEVDTFIVAVRLLTILITILLIHYFNHLLLFCFRVQILQLLLYVLLAPC